ncbi:tetratricopeptide repeat protein [bacterium]|nr:tetratricopeptide repeat protein [bacterium]
MRYFFLLLLTIFILSGCDHDKVAAKRDLGKGIQFLRSGQYMEAGIHFKSAIEKDPKNPDPHYYYALLSIQQKKTDQAIESLSKVLMLKPMHEEAAIYLADLFIQKNEGDGAIKVLKPFTTVTKNDKVFFYLGKAFYTKNDFEEAVKWFQKTLEINNNNSSVYGLLGDSLLRMNNIEQAQKILKEAVKYNQDPVVLSKLGTVLFQIGNDFYLKEKKAKTDLTEIDEKVKKKKKLSKDEESKKSQLEQDRDDANGKKTAFLSEAKNQFQLALKKDPALKESAYNLSMTHYLLEEYEDARKMIERFIQLSPTGAQAKEAREQMDQLDEIIRIKKQEELNRQK